MATQIKIILSKVFKTGNDEIKTNTDWRSIYIATFVSLLAAIQNFTVSFVLWPYIKFVSASLNLQNLTYLRVASGPIFQSPVRHGPGVLPPPTPKIIDLPKGPWVPVPLLFAQTCKNLIL